MDPEEIENRQFLVQLRGYARDEVEAFREEVAQEIKILRKQLTKATSDLSHANSELANVKTQLAEASAQLAEERSRLAPEAEPAPEATEAPPAVDRASMFHMVGQETERILLAAEEAAEQIHEQAVKESAELMADTRMRVERSLAEFEAARRAAEEDFAGIRDSRSMVASQMEDIRRRLEETISRLRVPVELPGSKPASRFRPQPETSERGTTQPPAEHRPVDAQAQRQREMEAAKELKARQTAHRGEANRREEELKAVQAEAEQRARAEAERRARDRAAAEVAARKAQQAADLHAAVAAAQEADRVQAAREAERMKAAEAERLKAEEAAAKARSSEEAAARQKAQQAQAEKAAAAKAEAEKAPAEKAVRAQAKAEKERAGREADKARAADAERRAEKSRKPPGPQPKEAGAGATGSSLDELLAEIRRKREEEERQAAQPEQSPAPAAAAPPAAAAAELSRRNEALGDLPAQTARRLKRLLQEEHNELLDRLRTQRGKGELDDNLSAHNEQLGRFISGLSEALNRAFSEGRKAAGSKGNGDPSAVVTKLVTRQVLNPLRSEISKAIEAGLEAQDSASSLSERANDVFRVWKGVRTQLLGEGIAYAAYHQGLVDAWGSRAGATKSWVFSVDEPDCPNEICRRNAEAGAVALKSPFPSGHLAPPAHGGCTCTLAGS